MPKRSSLLASGQPLNWACQAWQLMENLLSLPASGPDIHIADRYCFSMLPLPPERCGASCLRPVLLPACQLSGLHTDVELLWAIWEGCCIMLVANAG